MQGSEGRFDWNALKARLDALSQSEPTHLSEADTLITLSERAARFRRAENVSSEDAEEMIVFEESGTRYAVPLRMLTEIRPMTRMTTLPLTSRNILGVINFRGRIVAIYSLSNGSAQAAATPTPKHAEERRGSALIGHGYAANMALFAENVIGTTSVKASEIRSAPISLSDRNYIAGVSSDGLVFLDLEKLVKNEAFYMA